MRMVGHPRVCNRVRYRKEVSSLIAAFKQKYGLVGQRFSEEDDKPQEQQKGPDENLALPFESRVPNPESRR